MCFNTRGASTRDYTVRMNLISKMLIKLHTYFFFVSSCLCLVQKRPLKRDGQVRELFVLDFIGVLSAKHTCIILNCIGNKMVGRY